MDKIPPEVQQKLVKFQQIQQQGQLIGQQRQQMELQLGETSRTIEEVDKALDLLQPIVSSLKPS